MQVDKEIEKAARQSQKEFIETCRIDRESKRKENGENELEIEKQPLPNGFAPCFDGILKDYGPITACMFGQIWRRAQSLGYSYTSRETFSKELHLSENTITFQIQKLIDLGFIVEYKPKNRPDHLKNIDARLKLYTPDMFFYEEKYPHTQKTEENPVPLTQEEIREIINRTKIKQAKYNFRTSIFKIRTSKLIFRTSKSKDKTIKWKTRTSIYRKYNKLLVTNIDLKRVFKRELNRESIIEINNTLSTPKKLGEEHPNFLGNSSTGDLINCWGKSESEIEMENENGY